MKYPKLLLLSMIGLFLFGCNWNGKRNPNSEYPILQQADYEDEEVFLYDKVTKQGQKSVTITGLTEIGKRIADLNIPKEIESLPVSSIENIDDVKQLEKITLSDEISIDIFANFYNAEKFDTLIIGDNCDVEVYGFQGADIKVIILGINSKVETSTSSFQGCTNLEKLIIGTNSEVKLGTSSFQSCQKLGLIYIHENSSLVMETSSLQGCQELEMIIIGENSKLELGTSVLQGCDKLSTIVLNENALLKVGQSALQGTNIDKILHKENYGIHGYIPSSNITYYEYKSVYERGAHWTYASGEVALWVDKDTLSINKENYLYSATERSEGNYWYYFTEDQINIWNYAKSDSGLTYSLNSELEFTLTNVSSTTTELFIPERINNYPVTKIAENVFDKVKYLNTISIPKTIRDIPEDLFKENKELKTVYIFSQEILDKYSSKDNLGYLFINASKVYVDAKLILPGASFLEDFNKWPETIGDETYSFSFYTLLEIFEVEIIIEIDGVVDETYSKYYLDGSRVVISANSIEGYIYLGMKEGVDFLYHQTIEIDEITKDYLFVFCYETQD